MIGDPLIPDPDDTILRQEMSTRRWLDDQYRDLSFVLLACMMLFTLHLAIWGMP